MENKSKTIDGNEAAAHVAYRVNDVIAIYPITPSSNMAELADDWSTEGVKNIWGQVPTVQQMQSEGGAAGAVHGALQAGAMATTFTASQGLLLMIPNMYKIAGELTPTVFHVAARSLATQALSIFGDHSDVMSTRATGFALFCSGSVQEAMDFALIAQAATLESRIPFIHFFDGFRTSHELATIQCLTDEDIRAMIDETLVEAHRNRSLSPDHPVLRGTAQDPDVFFQSRESVNKFYDACPSIVQKVMDKFAQRTGRSYHAFDYHGAPDATRVIVIMGSGAEAVQETVDALQKKGEKVGVLRVRLYRPFAVDKFVEALPSSARVISVLDRTKEPGSCGEPLYLDIVNALSESSSSKFASAPKIIGGRYGLASKEFTPAMVKGVFDEMSKLAPKNHFTIGIKDDVTNTSLDYDPAFSTEPENEVRAVFYGLGADGTVSANKNSIKIIAETTKKHAQGYFVYDSKKSGSTTVSHLRFGAQPIRSSYLVQSAHFVGCHQFGLMDRFDVLEKLVPGGVFLLNSHLDAESVWDGLPRSAQDRLIEKRPRFYVIDAYKVAHENHLGARINTVMQTCFFALSNVLPREEAIRAIKVSIEKTYGVKGEEVVQLNYNAVDQTLAHMFEVKIPSQATKNGVHASRPMDQAPDFVRNVLGKIMTGRGDTLPVSAFPADGTFPVGTARFEKRNIAEEIPVWDEKICIQCGKCVIVCPHAVIRAKVYDPKALEKKPATFKSAKPMNRNWDGLAYTLQVAAEDCTGCGICVDVCPVKNKSETRLRAINMQPQAPLQNSEQNNWDFFLGLPEADRRRINKLEVRSNALLEPLFEFSGACAGCGETPYIKLVSQLFGDRMMVANATGCSSIYGGNLPTTPWTKNLDGRGPAWSNSLFEDNAEFGLGFRLAIDQQEATAVDLLKGLESVVGTELVRSILEGTQKDEAGIFDQRQRVEVLKQKLKASSAKTARLLLGLADYLVKKSVWIVGGDGWAYDIGYGGLDHVLASGKNTNVLVLDTEVYSNTGGQKSKSTPKGAVAKFAAAGKSTSKKDMALIAMSYGNVYVASVAMGARDEHTVRAFLEAEAYDGPSMIIAYSHCIAHGINMTTAMRDQKLAVDSGYWPLFRYNPTLTAEGKNPLILDSQGPKVPLKDFLYTQNRYKMLAKSHPERARKFLDEAQAEVRAKWGLYQDMASLHGKGTGEKEPRPVGV